jgi:hypothetical protein
MPCLARVACVGVRSCSSRSRGFSRISRTTRCSVQPATRLSSKCRLSAVRLDVRGPSGRSNAAPSRDTAASINYSFRPPIDRSSPRRRIVQDVNLAHGARGAEHQLMGQNPVEIDASRTRLSQDFTLPRPALPNSALRSTSIQFSPRRDPWTALSRTNLRCCGGLLNHEPVRDVEIYVRR